MGRVLLASVSVILCGCALSAQQRAEVDQAANIQRDSRLISGYALRSQLQDLADSAFEKSQAGDATHYLSVLDVGEDALIARLHLIRAARQSVDLQTFIWVDDDTGRLVFNELLLAARRGVKVRLLVDHFCKTDNPQVLARAATAHTNLDLKIYNPVFDRMTNKPREYLAAAVVKFEMLNQRMHNKVMVVDQRIGLVGGRNIEDRYFDWDPKFNFVDRDVIVAGPAATEMHASFEHYWNHNLSRDALRLVDVSRAIRDPKEVQEQKPATALDLAQFAGLRRQAEAYSLVDTRPAMRLYSTAAVEFVADAPEKTLKGEPRGGAVTARINEILSAAEQRIAMQTPYMVLSNRSIRMFKKIRRERPEMDLVFSTNSLAATDAFYVYAMSFKQRKLLVKKLKFQVHELKPIPADATEMIPRYEQLQALSRSVEYDPNTYKGIVPIASEEPRLCIHAKTFVVDHRVTLIGSHNFEPRSNKLNTESGVFIWDEDVARAVEENILQDMAPQNSWVLGERKRIPVASNVSDVVASVSRALPFFDVWPFRYSTSYQLKEGKTPTSPFSPEFKENYQDVGTFPQVNMSSEKLSLRLISAFGGWSRPLM